MSTTAERVIKEVERQTGARAIVAKTRLEEDLGMDSLDHVELVMFIEEEFEIEIDDEKADSIKTVADIIKLVDSIINKE